MSRKDYYDILSVSRDASQDQIKQAYRKMALKYHPDRNKGDKSKEEKFKEASEAYQVLGDSKRRQQYDQFGHNAFGGGSQGFSNFEDLGDIFSAFKDIFEEPSFFGGGQGGASFEDLFTGGRSRRSRHRGADLQYALELNFKEVLTGAKKDISFQGEVSCSGCKGTGAKPGTRKIKCSHCEGKGQVFSRKGFISFSSTCPQCRGQGAVLETPCAQCYGRGKATQKRTLQVKIPAGVDHGTQLRMREEGEPGVQGAEAGDLYIEVRLKHDSQYIKSGKNLKVRLSITYLQALLGCQKEVSTLTGKEKIRVPKGTQSGDKLILSHEGLPSLKDPTRGDLIYEIQVEIPKKLKKKEENLLRQIAELKKEIVSPEKTKLF